MAVYKVPQDVESEDKLIGPFGFRQFIYLIIVAFAGFVAYLLSQIFIGLVLIPLPFIIFFGAIALPLRKDQPTEVYLLAVIQYHLKPKVRMWQPDGAISTVEITAPKTVEESRVKDLSEEEALDRLGHLAQIMDTRGWAARGVFNPDIDSTANTQLSAQAIADAAEPDILDGDGISAQSFDQLIDQQKVQQKQAVMQKIASAQAQTSDNTQPVQTTVNPQQTKDPSLQTTPMINNTPSPQNETAEDQALLKKVKFNPYPSTIHQQVIQPLSSQQPQQTTPTPTPQPQTQTTSDSTPNPDIIELVNSPFSVATIAGEIHRKEESKTQEVEIKLH